MALENLLLDQIMSLINSGALYLMVTNYSWKRKVRFGQVAFDLTGMYFSLVCRKLIDEQINFRTEKKEYASC